MTNTEKILWMHLRSGIQNFKFRRQHPIGLYVADFYCHKLKLIIEIDGCIHNLEEPKINDKKREKFFVDLGYTVKRFTNKQVQNDIEFILSEVNSFIESSRNILLNEKSSPPFREVLGGLL
jgi:very-short-patch-repair endonuclease